MVCSGWGREGDRPGGWPEAVRGLGKGPVWPGEVTAGQWTSRKGLSALGGLWSRDRVWLAPAGGPPRLSGVTRGFGGRDEVSLGCGGGRGRLVGPPGDGLGLWGPWGLAGGMTSGEKFRRFSQGYRNVTVRGRSGQRRGLGARPPRGGHCPALTLGSHSACGVREEGSPKPLTGGDRTVTVLTEVRARPEPSCWATGGRATAQSHSRPVATPPSGSGTGDVHLPPSSRRAQRGALTTAPAPSPRRLWDSGGERRPLPAEVHVARGAALDVWVQG